MAYHKLDPGDEEFLEKCPKCEIGYMVPNFGDWYQCSECGLEAQMDKYGLLEYDVNDLIYPISSCL